MADYIDREAFRAVLQKSHRYHAGNCREVSLLSRDIRLLNEQPAADVAPVVRDGLKEKLMELIEVGVACPDDRGPFDLDCRDCKYAEAQNCDIERLADYLIAHGVTVMKEEESDA